MVSWFVGFLVFGFLFVSSWCLLSWFQSFKDTPNFHCTFLIDIDFISKISKNLLDGASGFAGPRLFQHRQNMDFQHFEIYKKTNTFEWPRDVLVFF